MQGRASNGGLASLSDCYKTKMWVWCVVAWYLMVVGVKTGIIASWVTRAR